MPDDAPVIQNTVLANADLGGAPVNAAAKSVLCLRARMSLPNEMVAKITVPKPMVARTRLSWGAMVLLIERGAGQE